MKTLIKVIIILLAIFFVIAAFMLAWLTVNEYRPKSTENVAIDGEANRILSERSVIRIASMNIGYCGLDATQDFIMDGGKSTRPDSKAHVQETVDGLCSYLAAEDFDFVLLQEVDKASKRTYLIDETKALASALGGTSAFATNFVAKYVPYPINDTIGKVESGLQTISTYDGQNAKRLALPVSYNWPIRTCQLKRCLLTQEYPIEGSKAKLVIVNLHLEAYATGDHKKKQLSVLTDFMESEYAKGNYVIAGGDFNMTPYTVNPKLYPVVNDDYFVADTLSADILPEGWVFATDDSVPTSRLLNEPYDPESKNTQYYVIDGFLVSPNVRVNSIKTYDEGFLYSDHNPVVLSVMLGD